MHEHCVGADVRARCYAVVMETYIFGIRVKNCAPPNFERKKTVHFRLWRAHAQVRISIMRNIKFLYSCQYTSFSTIMTNTMLVYDNCTCTWTNTRCACTFARVAMRLLWKYIFSDSPSKITYVPHRRVCLKCNSKKLGLA